MPSVGWRSPRVGVDPRPSWSEVLTPACVPGDVTEIDPGDLLPNERVQQAVLAGDVTQLTRGASNRYADEGDTFEIDGATFAVTSVEHRTLGDFTDADARREGSESVAAYKRRMERAHPGDFEWDDGDEVLTYRFERRD